MASLEERLAEAQQTGRLNLSYLGSPAAVDDALAWLASAPQRSLRAAECDLSSNELETLPAGLGAALPRLRALRAKYNRFGVLPTEALGPLQLEALDLEGNQIACLADHALPALGPQLRRLNLASNGLAALPDSVARCRGLEALTLSNNPLAALPEALAGCPVTHLDVSGCRLTALTPVLATCRTLQRFFCQNNDLSRVPTALGHLGPNLKEWNLRANRLPLKYEQARERGLAKFLAFLREEEEIERLQEVERNRPVGITSGPCMIFRCKAVLDDAVAAARAGEPTDGFAWIRAGHAAVAHRNQLLVFGGVLVRDGRKTAELLVLDTDTMGWRVQPTRGDPPCPRDGHVLVVDPTGGTGAGQLVLFGGRNAGGRRLNDLHVLDLATWTWFVPKQEGTALPAPREQAAAAFSPDGRLLLFGGRTNGARLNDLWSWDVESGLWEQLPSHGTAPSPRQGAAACMASGHLFCVAGGSSNFVLHDVATDSLEAQEWRALSIEGQSKAAARAGGHIICWQPEPGAGAQSGEGDGAACGSLWLFGGRDALGAQVPYLLKLRPRGGGAWYEWVETEFSMLPNRSRLILFDSSDRLNIAQCGHPLHKLNVSADQIEKGSCIWDVVQMVPLSSVRDREVRPEDVAAANPKRERIKHASLIAGKLPPAFSSNTAREQQVLAAAAGFRQRWAAGSGAGRLPPPVSLLNECGVEKVVYTTVRPTALPHTDLHDLADIAQFVSEFFTFEPLEDAARPPTHLVSPWSLLEWQAGDSFDLATLACSLLLGAGYSAYVVVGYTSKQVALCDHSRTECPWLAENGLEPPAYAELPGEEPSFEELEGGAGEEGELGSHDAAESTGATPSGPEAAEPAGAGAGAEVAAAAAGASGDGPAGAGGSVAVEPPAGQAWASQVAQHAGPDEQRPLSGRTEASGGSRPATSKVAAATSRPLTASTAAGPPPATGKGRAAGSRPATGTSAAAGSARPATVKTAAASSRPATGKAAKGSLRPQVGSGKTAKGSTPPVSGKAKAKAGSRLAATTAKQVDKPQGADIQVAPENDPPAVDAAATEAEAAPPASESQKDPHVLCAPALPPQPRRWCRRYMHAFVLVKPGRREVMQALLLDPGSGRTYSMDEAPCTGVECAWNDRNFWASLQTDSRSGDGSGGGSGLAELGVTDWSFSNPNCWLPLLASREEERVEAATLNTHPSLHSSKASEALLRSASTLPGRTLSTLSCHKEAGSTASPRPQPQLGCRPGSSASTAGQPGSARGGSNGLPRAASIATGVGPPGGVALQHLAMGARSGTPRLSMYAPTRELADSSLAFLSPEETAAAQQCSSLQPAPSAVALLPPASSTGLARQPIIAPSSTPAFAAPRSTLGSALDAAAAPATAAAAPASPEVPLSWVPQLAISRERLDMRCPGGQKVVGYRQAQREVFARYGECGRWDGLVERLTTFDGRSNTPLCVLELFNRRRDKLVRRLAWPGQRATLSTYAPSAQGCLKCVRMVRGVGAQRQTELTFYAENRADGLMRRQRKGTTMEEWFLPGSRPDGLIHRTVVYLAASNCPGAPPAGRASSVLGTAAKPGSSGGAAGAAGPGPHCRHSSVVVGADLEGQAVASIHEEFSQGRQAVGRLSAGAAAAAGASAAQGDQVLACRFDLLSGETELVALAAAAGEDDVGEALVTRTYDPDGLLLVDEGDAAPATLPAEQQLREHVALVAARRAAQAAVLAAEEESRDLLQLAQRQEQGDSLVTPHYDATRIKVEESDSGEAVDEEPDQYDFLQHFLPHTGTRDLSAGEAEVAMAACLAAFDDRQADRSRLLSLRLAECGAELARLRGVELTHLSPADQERVRAEEAAAAFRLRVVQRRLEEHAPTAAERRAELEARLAADRRLAAALAPA